MVRHRDKQLEFSLEEWLVAQARGQVVRAEHLVVSVWVYHGLIHDHELQRQAESLTRKLNQDPVRQIVLRVPGVGCQLFPSLPNARPRSGYITTYKRTAWRRSFV